ncbi:MAG TPA: hypothetical protein VMH86_01540 [Rhizomicrobium sp.]|nr:hypothetical protein [Rhizomicrobium sp.]
MVAFKYKKVKKGLAHAKEGQFTILAIDIVSFTALGNNKSFKHAVHELESAIDFVLDPVTWDEDMGENDAVLSPTGDGYFVGFQEDRVSDKDVLQYAGEISNRLKDRSFPVRMGINKGYCFVYRDLNDKLNLCGWGIIEAERVMSCGGKNHILCTEPFVKSYIDRQPTAKSLFEDIGPYLAKGGRKLSVFNYYKNGEYGNSLKPKRKK